MELLVSDLPYAHILRDFPSLGCGLESASRQKAGRIVEKLDKIQETTHYRPWTKGSKEL